VAVDIFLKLGDIHGGALDEKHKDEIQIFSFSWGESAPVATGGGAGDASGKAQVSQLNLMAQMGTASVPIFLACARGDHIPSATLSLRKVGSPAGDFLKFALGQVQVSSYQISASAGGDDAPTESISLAFGAIAITYTPQRPDGSAGTPITGAFDFVKQATF